jgi:hypothetical protein
LHSRAQSHLCDHQQLRALGDNIKLAHAAAVVSRQDRKARLLQQLHGPRFGLAADVLAIYGEASRSGA